MADGLTINLSGTERVLRALEARRRELKETTKQACVAIAVTTLRGVRSRTRVANEKRVRVTAKKDLGYVVAYSKKTGRGLVVGRNGKMPQGRDRATIHWTEQPTSRKHGLHVYRVVHAVDKAGTKTVEWRVVAKTEAAAAKWGKDRAAKRILRRKGLARLSLGYCMHDLAVQTGLGAANGADGDVTGLARRNADATIDERGFSSGEVAVRVSDRLRYASRALTGGQKAVDAALDAALNKTRGLIVSKLKKDGRVTDALAIKGLF